MDCGSDDDLDREVRSVSSEEKLLQYKRVQHDYTLDTLGLDTR